jgi:hypothetical protein
VIRLTGKCILCGSRLLLWRESARKLRGSKGEPSSRENPSALAMAYHRGAIFMARCYTPERRRNAIAATIVDEDGYDTWGIL